MLSAGAPVRVRRNQRDRLSVSGDRDKRDVIRVKQLVLLDCSVNTPFKKEIKSVLHRAVL
jgi:hypothetical protein